MKKILLAGVLACGALASSAVNPLWIRDAKISPDGERIAFGYKGDIYTVNVNGGSARKLTSGSTYESAPVWSPDGKKIAFASDRNGGKDIYIMDSNGGAQRRLTSNSAAETPEAFSPDGKEVIFSAVIQDPASSALAPNRTQSELYAIPVEGGKMRQIIAVPAVNVSMRPDGGFLYEDVKGLEDKWRKHHTSSVTRDVWLYDPAGGYVNLTHREGEDRNPVIASDGKSYYFLSERNGGSFNVYKSPLKAGASVEKLTDFTTHPVRFLSRGAGDILAYVYNGELYTQKPGQQPVKLSIDIIDEDNNDIEDVRFSTVQGAVVSPDGKQMVFTERGEVFVTSTEYPSLKQITHTPAIESRISWGSDGRSLYYGSLRSGRSNIYKATIARKDDPNFSNATLIEEKALFPEDGVERGWPVISPDGKKMAFVEDRNKLKVMDLASGKVTTLTEDKASNYRTGGYPVFWSPDSKWLTLEIMNPMHDPYGDIAIVNVDNGEFINLTNTGYFDQEPRFTPDGNAVIFASERYGMRNHASWGSEYDVMMVFLNQEAYDKYRLSEEDYALLKEVEEQQKKAAKKDEEKKSDKKGKKDKKGNASDSKKEEKDLIKVEPEGIMERIVRLTPNSSNLSDYYVTKDGSTLYYVTSFEDGYDLWKKDLRKGDVSQVKKLGRGGVGIQTDKDENLYLAGSSVKKFNPKSKELKPISVSGTVKVDPAAEREVMLDFVANEARERFYLPEMPVDWDMYVANYRRFLPHINNGYDFADLMSELLGELNVSHSGGRYFPAGAKDQTASLGLLCNMEGKPGGAVIEEIIEKGPFDRASTKVKPGDVIEAINGESTADLPDWEVLLNNTAGKKTLVSFRRPSTGEKWDEVVLPIRSAAMSDLLYNRWVKSREEAVDSLSGGRLGYVHLRSMSDGSFRDVYSKLLGKYYNKEGIVIDTRWNGGGRLHEDIEVLFSGEKYLTQEIHGKPSGEMPSRRWNKPSIMIIGEANYSNAHGTPWVYKHKNMGKLVGMPVPGTMSSVNWIDLQNPDMLFGVPVVAFRTADGTVLENTQLEPDIKVANEPADVVRGIDAQLKAAVEELLKEL
ncbi:MAG: peptidase S41 [Muribaculaceae bacterium]|nr:peptidase S41 [Muribaculaceae bacterium]